MSKHIYRLTNSILVAIAAYFFVPAVVLAQNVPFEDAATDPVNVQYWTIITGFVLPPIISIIIKSRWSRQVQSLVAFGVALLATVGQLWLYGQFHNFVDPASSFLFVMVSTIAFYKGLWEPTGVSPAIERSVLSS